MRLALLSLAALLSSAHVSAQTSLIQDLRGTPDNLIGAYGEPDQVYDNDPHDLWRYFGTDEGIARFYSVNETDVVRGSFIVEYFDESAAYARVFALKDRLTELGFPMAERDGHGIYNAFGLGSREGAMLNVLKHPEVGGRFSYKVTLSILDLPPSAPSESAPDH